MGYKKNTTLSEAVNRSPFICNVVSINEINIHHDKIGGVINSLSANGEAEKEKAGEFYSFMNTSAWGEPIYIRNAKDASEFVLLNKNFKDYTLTFDEEDGKPINFMKTQITLRYEISQV